MMYNLGWLSILKTTFVKLFSDRFIFLVSQTGILRKISEFSQFLFTSMPVSLTEKNTSKIYSPGL